MGFSKSQRLTAVICISTSFFLAELSVGFYTKSLTLIADAFHYLNDVIGFIVALTALKISQRPTSPDSLSFGWQRAEVLGAFFNGVFLLALGVSIFVQSINRFISLQRVDDPKLMLIIGCVGLISNLISAFLIHDHDHHGHHHGHGRGHFATTEDLEQSSAETLCVNSITTSRSNIAKCHKGHQHTLQQPPIRGYKRDLASLAVLLHVLMDAINNIGVIIAALVIWRAHSSARFYADPGVSMGISIMIIISTFSIIRSSGSILLQSVPLGVNIEDVKHDIESIPGILSIHELHIWGLCQKKTIASAHIVTNEVEIRGFMGQAKLVRECFHAYGIHSVTLQAEAPNGAILDVIEAAKCLTTCGSLCEDLTCCS
ncbi:hypothetical protein ACMFMG_003514 [Clarireedia jacksonii]